jgi:hypothetical protein
MKEYHICAIVLGCVNNIIVFEDYYFLHNCVFYTTRAFSTSVVARTFDDGASPPGRSTELDDKTGHACKMPCALYNTFCALVLGLAPQSWVNHFVPKLPSTICSSSI